MKWLFFLFAALGDPDPTPFSIHQNVCSIVKAKPVP
jgi:hypothetical protein